MIDSQSENNKKGETKAKKALNEYLASKERRKAEIRQEPSKWKRFWKWMWFWMSFPFRWVWMACHDWRILIILIIVFVVYSSSVWGFYLAGLICYKQESVRNWLWGIGSAMWVWWLGPFTPFMELVVLTTMGIKAVIDKIKYKKHT